MIDNITSLAEELIAIETIADNKEALNKALEVALAHLSGYTIERFETNSIKSVLVYNTPVRPKHFKVVLNGHLDVIGGKKQQYTPVIKQNKLYGVGAADMKAGAACLILAFKEIASKVSYPLALQLVTDEEVGGMSGTKYQIDQGVRADFAISGETTNLNIATKAKGVLWVKITCKGRAAHSAYPWKGDNAIWKMNRFLSVLGEEYKSPLEEEWVTTVNPSKIEADNSAHNKIPEDCKAWLDIRYIPEDKDIVEDIRQLLPAGFTMEVELNEPAHATNERSRYVRSLRQTAQEVSGRRVTLYGAHGSSDARFFQRIGCESVEFGPVAGGGGSTDEWASVPGLEQYYKILTAFLSSL